MGNLCSQAGEQKIDYAAAKALQARRQQLRSAKAQQQNALSSENKNIYREVEIQRKEENAYGNVTPY